VLVVEVVRARQRLRVGKFFILCAHRVVSRRIEKQKLTDQVQRADAQTGRFQEAEEGGEEDWAIVW
jgi:hypothetical protein